MTRYLALTCGMAFAMVVFMARPAPAQRTAGESPQQVIARFHDVLLQCMTQAKTLGFAGRYLRLEPAVDQTFNLAGMTKLAVGARWNSLTEAQRQALIEAFGRYTVTSYASHFDGYDGERFEMVGERPSPTGGIIVDTRMVRRSDEPVEFDYLMREDGGRWRVLDIYVVGTVSEMATRRSEFSATLRAGGADALLELLRRKIAELTPPS